MWLKASIKAPTKIFNKEERVLLLAGSLALSVFISFCLFAVFQELGIHQFIPSPFSALILVFWVIFLYLTWWVIIRLLKRFFIWFRNYPGADAEILKTPKADKRRITKVPGAKLLAIVDFLFRPGTVELTFKPLIGDWQSEYFEALHQRRTKKARWISFRYRFIFACTFFKAMGLSKVFSLFKQVSK